MIRAVFLDSEPAGLITQRDGKSADVDACKAWLAVLDRAGVAIYVPEIIDYEVRRELLRDGRRSASGSHEKHGALPAPDDCCFAAGS